MGKGVQKLSKNRSMHRATRLGEWGGERILDNGESIGKDPRGAWAWHLRGNIQQANIAGTDTVCEESREGPSDLM